MVDATTPLPSSSLRDPSTAEYWTLGLLLLLESPCFADIGVALAHKFVVHPDDYGFATPSTTHPAREPFIRWAVTGVIDPEGLRDEVIVQSFKDTDPQDPRVRCKREACVALAEIASAHVAQENTVLTRRTLVLYLLMAAIFSAREEALGHLNRALEVDPTAAIADPLFELAIARATA